MRQQEIWDVDTAQTYNTPGTGMFAQEVLGPTVDRLTELAGDGRALEFAIGTGRVAVNLSERGVPVTGIELSIPMIDQLRTKVDVPELRRPPPGQRATVWHAESGYIGLDTYDVLQQQVVSHHPFW
ncbi:MAG TPA: class I SAM-dependent methyltransferase [Mycobacteriales bacterium]|jgi:hypothetical protein